MNGERIGRPFRIDDVARVPIDRRRLPWVGIHLVRDRGKKSPRTNPWRVVSVIGFFDGVADAKAYVDGDRVTATSRWEFAPFVDAPMAEDDARREKEGPAVEFPSRSLSDEIAGSS